MTCVIALCHFCEQHGPRTMFTCEKSNPTAGVTDVDVDSTYGSVLENSGSYLYSSNGSTQSSSSYGSIDSLTSNNFSFQQQQKTNLCPACQSIPKEQPGYVTHIPELQSSFVSMQYPENNNTYKLVKQACIRSLSCETSPGKEGPILFGDDDHSYTLSNTFHLQDPLARGQRRRYSIICLMNNKMMLIQSWPFLVGCVNRIIEYLQVGMYTLYFPAASNRLLHAL